MPILRGLSQAAGQPLGPTSAPTFAGLTLASSGSSGTLATMNYDSGAKSEIKFWNETVTIGTAPPSNTSNQMPAGCTVLAVLCRVTTAVPSPTTGIDLTDSANSNYFTGTLNLSPSANSTLGANKICPYPRAGLAAASISLTPQPAPGSNSGRVEVTCIYEEFTPPTS